TFRLAPGSPGKLVRADDLAQPATAIATTPDSNRHVAFAVYVPPADFPAETNAGDEPADGQQADEPKQTDTASARAGKSTPVFDALDITIEGQFYPASNPSGSQQIQHELQLVRPPVVLIHGLHHNPRLAWQTPPPAHIGKTTMHQVLESRGF